MDTLSEERFRREAAPILRRVFVREDPWDEPFAPDVEERRLLYPVSYVPDSALLDAIAFAALETGDSGLYWSVMERPESKMQDRTYHWYIPFEEIKVYESFTEPYVLENVLYSPRGQWGIMTSHENHALLGGTTAFFEAMRRVAPGFDDVKQVQAFLSDWKDNRTRYGAELSWIPRLLRNVYGDKMARRFLIEANLVEML